MVRLFTKYIKECLAYPNSLFRKMQKNFDESQKACDYI